MTLFAPGGPDLHTVAQVYPVDIFLCAGDQVLYRYRSAFGREKLVALLQLL